MGSVVISNKIPHGETCGIRGVGLLFAIRNYNFIIQML